jgi:hypothetical protein
MRIVSLLVLVPLMIYGWAIAHPLQARAMVAELKRQWRLYLIQRKGESAAADVVQELRVQARNQGMKSEQIEEVIYEKWPELVERLGTRATNEILGKPTPLERYH